MNRAGEHRRLPITTTSSFQGMRGALACLLRAAGKGCVCLDSLCDLHPTPSCCSRDSPIGWVGLVREAEVSLVIGYGSPEHK